jgi:hypothetical protein
MNHDNSMHWITMSSSKYFNLLCAAIDRFYELYPDGVVYVGDLGLTKPERTILLNNYNAHIIDRRGVGFRFYVLNLRLFRLIRLGIRIIVKFKIPHRNTFRTIIKKENWTLENIYYNKPIFILDALEKIKDKSRVVYADADSIFNKKIDDIFINDFTILLTSRPAKEIKIIDDYIQFINAGVIYMNNSSSLRLFISDWIERIPITDEYLIEQTSLNRIAIEAGIDPNKVKSEGVQVVTNKHARIIVSCDKRLNYTATLRSIVNEAYMLHFKGGRWKESARGKYED